MKKLLLFTVLVLVAAASAAYTLNLFDKIVQGTLYYYGLRFSYEWANPYWMTLRVVQVLVSLTAVFSVVNFVYVYRKFIRSKPRVTMSKVEKKVSSSPILEPEPVIKTQRVEGLVKCPHCNRVFAQPLRMLDFHSDRPRIINICPFCNEVIPPILRNEEVEKGKKTVLKGKKNEQTRGSGETVQKEETRAAKEMVTTSA